MLAQFERYIGVDYSGAETPSSGLTGLRVFVATRSEPPHEIRPEGGRHWTRRTLARWLCDRLADRRPTIAGIDHCFSFPIDYFERYGVPCEWPAFLADFHAHWPTDEEYMYVDFVRDGASGKGALRTGRTTWRRETDRRAGGKSPFQFDVPGSVAKSTHAGLPWLRHMREELGGRVHWWPFDGWTIDAGRSVIVEVYPALCASYRPAEPMNGHQQDACAVTAWLRAVDASGELAPLFAMPPDVDEPRARIEGWILGVREGRGGGVNRRNPQHAFSATALRRLSDDELLQLSRDTRNELRRRKLDRAAD